MSVPSEKGPVLLIAPEICTLPLDTDDDIPMSWGQVLDRSSHGRTTSALSPARVSEKGLPAVAVSIGRQSPLPLCGRRGAR